MTSFWCELAWLGGDQAVAGVLVSVIDDRIAAVEQGVPCPPDATRLPGLTIPGMANAHSHAFHRALRGRTHVGGGSFWTWRDQMYGVARRLDPQRYFDLARAVYAEMAMAGITAVGEFHYLHHGDGGRPYADANAMSEALVAAAGEAGVRITLLDTCYLHGGVGIEPNEVQRRFSDGSATAWAERVDAFRPAGAHALVGAAVHSVRAVDPESIAVVAGWAAARAAVLHAHVSEQPAENEQTSAAFGLTPTQLLAERAALSERFTAVHATHLTPDDVGLLGGHRCAICMCPTTERDLADGIGPAAALRDAGAVITLGSDSHAVIDLFEEARAVELDERLATRVRGHHRPADLWRAATEDGHRSIGWTDAGALRVGALADLVSVRLDSVRTAGATAATALDTVLYAAGAADVHTVVASGRVVVDGGRHRTIDVPAALTATIHALSEDE